jgi:hypothetical protein
MNSVDLDSYYKIGGIKSEEEFDLAVLSFNLAFELSQIEGDQSYHKSPDNCFYFKPNKKAGTKKQYLEAFQVLRVVGYDISQSDISHIVD